MVELSAASAQRIVALSRSVTLLIDDDSSVQYVSQAAGEMLGWTRDDLCGVHTDDLVHPSDQHAWADLLEGTASSGGSCFGIRVRMHTAEQAWREVDVIGAGHHTFDEFAGHVVTLVAVQSPEVYDHVLDSVLSGASLPTVLTTIADAINGPWTSLWMSVHFGEQDGRFTEMVTTAGRETFRRALEAASDGDDYCLWDPTTDNEELTYDSRDFSDGIALASRHTGLAAARIIPCVTGTRDAVNIVVWFENTYELDEPAFRGRVAQLSRLIGLAVQRQASDARLAHAETHDPLTGVCNRPAFFDALKDFGTKRGSAVVQLDIDNFAAVNEWHGQAGGDQLLRQVADRLSDAVRPGDLVARLGADEFAILCHDVRADAGATIAERVLSALEQTFLLRGERLEIMASVGIAMSEPGRTSDQLLEAASRAVQEVKQSAPGTFRIA